MGTLKMSNRPTLIGQRPIDAQPAKNEQAMKKADSDEMRPEYDFSSGVRGKYLPRLAKGANVVVLDRDMAKGRRHGKAKGSTRGV
jgi:hypothetical protein